MKAFAWYNFIFALLWASVGTLFGLVLRAFAWSPPEQVQANVVLFLALASIPHIIFSKKVISRLNNPEKPLVTRGMKGLAWYTITYVVVVIAMLVVSLPFHPNSFLLDIAYAYGDMRDYIVLVLIVAILVFGPFLFASRILRTRPK